MDCLRINSSLHALINFTRWTLIYLIPGNTSLLNISIVGRPIILLFFKSRFLYCACSGFGSLHPIHLLLLNPTLLRCNILKRVPKSALWLLRFPAAGEARLRACKTNIWCILVLDTMLLHSWRITLWYLNTNYSYELACNAVVRHSPGIICIV